MTSSHTKRFKLDKYIVSPKLEKIAVICVIAALGFLVASELLSFLIVNGAIAFSALLAIPVALLLPIFIYLGITKGSPPLRSTAIATLVALSLAGIVTFIVLATFNLGIE